MEQLKALDYKDQIATLYQEYKNRLNSEPELTEKILEIVLTISTQNSDTTEIALALFYLGKSNRKHGKPDNAIEYLTQSKTLYQQLKNYERVVDCMNELGIANKNIGKYQQALNLYFEALKIVGTHKYEQGEIRILSNISVILIFQQDYEKAIEYLEKSLVMQKEEAKKNTIYNNLGIAYKALNKTDKALEYFNKSIESSKLANDIYWQASALNNIGIIYLVKKEYNKALEYFLKVEAIEEQTGNKKGLIGTYINIGVIKRYKLQYKDAIEWFQKADSLVTETKSLYEQKLIYLNFSLTYEEWGKHKKAVDYLYHYIALKDSLFNEKKNLQMTELVSKYEADKKQQEIELLKKERSLKELAMQKQKSEFELGQLKAQNEADKKHNELTILQNHNEIQQLVLEKNTSEIERLKLNASLNETIIQAEQSKAGRQATIRNVTILISLLIVVPVVVLLIFYQQKIKAQSIVSVRNEQLNQQKTLELIKDFELKTIKAQLEGQEKERLRIASELHDGVGGNLAGIKLGLTKIADQLSGNSDLKHIMTQVNETCDEIRSISHDLTPNKILNSAYINLIRAYLFQNIDSKKIKLSFQAYPEYKLNSISDDIKIEVYRIIQELLANVIKHAQTNEIDISLNLNNESLILMIEDSGVGFNPNRIIKGIGLLNIDSRVASLNGKLTIDSIIGRGTIFTVEIPLVNDAVA
ncbi:MAG: sensor histidine kinase [Cyclobacteriaceae bacterium]|nr:sensor histidine kinase [Cyclobacteriaceae bacterium]